MENSLNIENDLQLGSRRNTLNNIKKLFMKLVSIIFPIIEIIFLIIMFFLYREYDSKSGFFFWIRDYHCWNSMHIFNNLYNIT